MENPITWHSDKRTLRDLIPAEYNPRRIDEISLDHLKKSLHPTQKPIDLIVKALMNSSKRDDLVLDLFLGSDSTLIACEKTNRKCYGMELDPRYIDVIIARWEYYTGKKAVKL